MKQSEFNKIINAETNTDPEIRIGGKNSDIDFKVERIIFVAGGAEVILSPNESDRTYGSKHGRKE